MKRSANLGDGLIHGYECSHFISRYFLNLLRANQKEIRLMERTIELIDVLHEDYAIRKAQHLAKAIQNEPLTVDFSDLLQGRPVDLEDGFRLCQRLKLNHLPQTVQTCVSTDP